MSSDVNLTALENEPLALPAEPGTAHRVWASVERALERIGDRLNPILVKESRQALKSKQFLITFGLLLLLGWGWSILGVAKIGPGAAVGVFGGQLFFGYFVILAFPLLIVVPFGAFRSLATEQETRTYELLSITALGTRQIVLGKLGSAVLQMTVYLSAISPCLGFTYLLRGIDLLSILYVLFWLTLASLGFSAIGLFMATISPKRQFQVIPMLASALGCCAGFIASLPMTSEFVERGGSRLLTENWFWVANGAILTAFLAYLLMVCEASAARLSFASDNRSTRLRAIMVLHQMLFTGWMTIGWVFEHGRPMEIYAVFVIVAGIQWYILGALMVGESPILFSRVKRQLPQSFLGRMFLTWFYPGPGKGYMLALTGLICTLLTACIGWIITYMVGWNTSPWRGGRMSFSDNLIPFGIIGLSYITIYLGLGLLILKQLRRFVPSGLIMSVLVQILLLLFGCLVPLVIYLTVPDLRYNSNYSLLQITNPFWTLAEVIDRSALPERGFLLIIVPLTAAAVFAMNLPGLIREVRSVRIIKPQRVIEEDAEAKAPHPVSDA